MAGGVTAPVAVCRDCFWWGEAVPDACPACGSPRLARHAELGRLAIGHVDCDAFYASVEKRDRPELADKPVIVGGGARGVVTTCCYIARRFGVRSAMPMFKARRLCPEAVIVPTNFPKYREESRRIMAVLRDLTPLVQPLSLDEAWLDLSGTERLHGGPPALALARSQARIERETGLTVSVGLAPNKFLAKIASDLDKPRGFTVIGAAEARAFLAPRPVGVLPGVGPAFARALAAAGHGLVGDLARAGPESLGRRFGESGRRLAQLALGEDDRRVDPHGERRSISAETTFDTDLSGAGPLEARLAPLCEKVARRARAADTAGRVVTLKLKAADFRIITRRRTLAAPTQTSAMLFATARAMLAAIAGAGRWRLIGVGLSDLARPDDGEGAGLFGGAPDRRLDAERAMDALRARFGESSVVSGRALDRRGR